MENQNREVLVKDYLSEDILLRANKCPSKTMIALFVFGTIFFVATTCYIGWFLYQWKDGPCEVIPSFIILMVPLGAAVTLFMQTISLLKERKRKMEFVRKKMSMSVGELVDMRLK